MTAREHLQRLQDAAAQRDAPRFLNLARDALLHGLATRWNTTLDALTPADIEARLGPEDMPIRRVFAMADEANYSGYAPEGLDFAAVTELVGACLEPAQPAVSVPA